MGEKRTKEPIIDKGKKEFQGNRGFFVLFFFRLQYGRIFYVKGSRKLGINRSKREREREKRQIKKKIKEDS